MLSIFEIMEQVKNLEPMMKQFAESYNEQCHDVKYIRTIADNTNNLMVLLASHFGIMAPVLPPVANPEDEIKEPHHVRQIIRTD